MQTIVALVGTKHDVVAPHAIVGVGHVVGELVNIAFCFGNVSRCEATHAQAKHFGRDFRARIVVENSKEIVGGVGIVLVVAAVALIGEQHVLVIAGNAAVVVGAGTKQKQVLEGVAIAVVEHFAEQAICHGVGRAR